MISAIEWVPQGAADPNPKRYELSKAEMEMLEAQADMDADLAQGGEDDSSDDGSNADGANGAAGSSKIQLEPVDMSTLPADLRMDEYSDDDEDDEAKAGGRVGNLLIGKETELMGTHLDEDGMPVEDTDEDDEDEEDGIPTKAIPLERFSREVTSAIEAVATERLPLATPPIARESKSIQNASAKIHNP